MREIVKKQQFFILNSKGKFLNLLTNEKSNRKIDPNGFKCIQIECCFKLLFTPEFDSR